MARGGVKVSVLEADLLGRENEVYAVVTIADFKQETKTTRKSANPRWMETLSFPTMDQTSIMTVALFQKNSFTADKELGETNARKLGQMDSEAWLPVYPKSSKGGQTTMSNTIGSIHLKFQASRGSIAVDLSGSAMASDTFPTNRIGDRSKSFVGEKYFNLKVVEAKSIAARDRNGSSDPYCEIRYGSMKTKTKTLKKTVNPIWNAEFICKWDEEPERPDVLNVVLYDKDMFTSDDYLGEVVITLSDLTLTDGLSDAWYNLISTKAGFIASGVLNLQIQFPRQGSIAMRRVIGTDERTAITDMPLSPQKSKISSQERPARADTTRINSATSSNTFSSPLSNQSSMSAPSVSAESSESVESGSNGGQGRSSSNKSTLDDLSFSQASSFSRSPPSKPTPTPTPASASVARFDVLSSIPAAAPKRQSVQFDPFS
mmetsp:Transcript_17478/g.28709  ORF Transcript_17478/g.28709 Transcript_17478/m.28709 type:complete len:431 (-) Transcript_17478:284-1576(-)